MTIVGADAHIGPFRSLRTLRMRGDVGIAPYGKNDEKETALWRSLFICRN